LLANKDYTVFDVTVTKSLLVGSATEMELSLGVKNLFDEDYEDVPGYPMPPRQWFAGLAMHF
jgi:outer membrane receptor protein involved in Fe transport